MIFYLLCLEGWATIYTKVKSISGNTSHHCKFRLWTVAFAKMGANEITCCLVAWGGAISAPSWEDLRKTNITRLMM